MDIIFVDIYIYIIIYNYIIMYISFLGGIVAEKDTNAMVSPERSPFGTIVKLVKPIQWKAWVKMTIHFQHPTTGF